MMDELQFKRFKKRLDELEALAEDYFKQGTSIPRHISEEYEEISVSYKEMLSKSINADTDEFLKDIE